MQKKKILSYINQSKQNQNNQSMIENSLISHRSVYDSFSKFQRAASDHKFRTKSIRMRTVTNDLDEHIVQKIGLPVIHPSQSAVKFKPLESAKKITSQELSASPVRKRVQSFKIIEKNYEDELNKMGVESYFLLQCFNKKCEQTQTKYQEHKYQVFLKNLWQRLCNSKKLVINQMGFGHISLKYFFEWFKNWDSHITELDLSYAEDLLKDEKMKVIKSLLKKDKKMMKLNIANSNLQGNEMNEVMKIVNRQKRLFALDMSNINSQALNRIGTYLPALQQFFRENQSVAIGKFDNLQIKREGFEYICRGIALNKRNPIKVLSLSNNHISGAKLCEPFSSLLRSGLTHLNLSNNPLGADFFQGLEVLKSGTIKELNLSQTKMNSENLYYLFEKMEYCKSLTVLKLDGNDFSHHWFGKIGEKLQINSSIQYLSMNNCQIKFFQPFFDGLYHNKYLKKLDASNNFVDRDSLVHQKIVNFFTFNKYLQELRIKFCNFSEPELNKIFEGLSQNKTVRILDISQNTLEDLSATNILKMLEQNLTLEQIGTEKLQISQQMKKRIQMKLLQNGSLREKRNFHNLKEQTKTLKARDAYTWEDLEDYQTEHFSLDENRQKLQERTQKLEEILTKKKNDLAVQKKKYRQEEESMQKTIQNQIRINIERTKKAQQLLDSLELKEEATKQELEEQIKKVQNLEIKIRQTNESNKKKENELEDRLRDHRYLQRKKSKSHRLDLSPRRYSTYGQPTK